MEGIWVGWDCLANNVYFKVGAGDRVRFGEKFLKEQYHALYSIAADLDAFVFSHLIYVVEVWVSDIRLSSSINLSMIGNQSLLSPC